MQVGSVSSGPSASPSGYGTPKQVQCPEGKEETQALLTLVPEGCLCHHQSSSSWKVTLGDSCTDALRKVWGTFHLLLQSRLKSSWREVKLVPHLRASLEFHQGFSRWQQFLFLFFFFFYGGVGWLCLGLPGAGIEPEPQQWRRILNPLYHQGIPRWQLFWGSYFLWGKSAPRN